LSLNWDASKVAESVRVGPRFENGEEFEGLSVITETFIFATLMLGIGKITEANAGEVFARLALYERLNGALISTVTDEGLKPRPITEQDVIDHIGLSTNASFTDEPRAKWLKRIVGDQMDSNARTVKRAQAAAKAVAAPVPA
jgi:hypothetical protein